MTEATQCSIGLAKEEECHKESYTQDVGLIQFFDLDDTSKRLVELRTGLSNEVTTLCHHHKQVLLTKYETYQRVCCNPFAIHSRPCKGKQ